MARTADTVIVDSGFWIGLLDPRDGHHAEAEEKAEFLEELQVLCPWPTLYEIVSSRLVKSPGAVGRFEEYLGQPGVLRIDDSRYRDSALREVFAFAKLKRLSVPLVDMVIRLMIDDVNLRTNYLLTFDLPHFADVCRKRRVEVL